MLLERARAQQLTLDDLVKKIEEENPAVRVCRDSDGSVSVDELAYMIHVDASRGSGEDSSRTTLKFSALAR